MVVRRPATAQLLGILVSLWAAASGLSIAVAKCISLVSRGGLAKAWEWADPSVDDLILPGILARRELPARPLTRVTHPGWGWMEGERRLAGPGLGGAATTRNVEMTVGRSTPRQAAPLAATVGGEGEQSARQWDPREPQDKGLRPPTL